MNAHLLTLFPVMETTSPLDLQSSNWSQTCWSSSQTGLGQTSSKRTQQREQAAAGPAHSGPLAAVGPGNLSEQASLKGSLAPDQLSHSGPSVPQNKYKEEGKKEMSSSLYSQLPETAEMQLAKTVQEFQSQVGDDARSGAQNTWT